MIEARVARLEEDVREIKTILREMQKDAVALREMIARIEGKLDRTPTAMQIWPMIVTTWIAGAGIVALAVRVVTT